MKTPLDLVLLGINTVRTKTALLTFLMVLLASLTEGKAVVPAPSKCPTSHSASVSIKISYGDDNRQRTHSAAKNPAIPFRYLNGFLIVDVIINDRIPLNFLFDTGSKHTILTDNDFIPFLGQLPEEEIKIIGSDLSKPVAGRIMRRTMLNVGDVRLENQSLILLEKGVLDLNLLTDEPIHGILGIGSFGAYGVKIDYQKRSIELLDSESITRHKKGAIIPIRVEKSKAYIDVITNFYPGKTQALSLLIDTGASLSMLVHTAKADTTLFPPKVVTGTFGYGLGGFLIGYVGRSDKINFGPFDLTDVITHFQILSEDNSSENVPIREGIIGNGILEQFSVIIDFKQKELHLRQTQKRRRPSPYDRSGIRLIKDGERLNRLRVQHIVEGSSADLAGIQVGDELLKVGFLPISLRSISSIETMFRRRVGKKIRLKLDRNGLEYESVITLKDLI